MMGFDTIILIFDKKSRVVLAWRQIAEEILP